jgi:tight adherence protein B
MKGHALQRRALGCAVVFVTLLLTAIAAAAEGDFDFVDTSDFPTVRLVITPPPIATPDEVTALRAYQDSEEQPAAVLPLGGSPVEMVLLIDTSGSMAGAPIAAAKEAAIAFVDALPAGSDVSILAFGDTVNVVAEPGLSRDELVAAVTAITTRGDTALYDAVIAAASVVDQTIRTRQFVVVLSDGGDTVSSATLEDVTGILATIPMGFYAIELAGSEPNPAALAAMAETTGGRVVPASDASSLSAAYVEIAATVVSQYAVVFEAVTGGQSTIEVVMTVAGEEVRLSADLILPAMPATSSGAVVTIAPPAARELTPPVSYVYPPPSRLQEDWALRTGAILVGITLLILLGYALQPSGGRASRSQLFSPLDPNAPRRTWSRPRRAIPVPGTPLTDRSQQSPSRRGIEAALDAAGIAISAGEYLVLVTSMALAGLAVGILSDSPLLALLLSVGAVMVPRAMLSRSARKRRAKFADQLEGTLQLISGSMRAGYGLVSAMSTVATEAPSPTSDEFGRVVIEVRVGRDLTSALRGVADRMRNDDLAWVTDAISIQQEVGGNLAEVLDAVGSTIRDRNQIRRQVQALSAEGRMSAVILIALPFGIAGVLAVVNPGYLETLFDTATGKVLMLIGSVLMVLGIIWIRRIVKIVF